MCVFVCVYKVDKRDYYYIYISYSAVHISNDYIEWHEVLSLLQIWSIIGDKGSKEIDLSKNNYWFRVEG